MFLMLGIPNLLCSHEGLPPSMLETTFAFKKTEGTLIDVILTPCRNTLKSSGTVLTGLSDHHSLIYTVLKVMVPRVEPHTVMFRSYKNLNREDFRNDLTYAPFHVRSVFDDVDDQY